MNGLKKAIDVLKLYDNRKPVEYWTRGNSYIFRLEDDGTKGCFYYIVEGPVVKPTNPIISKLRKEDAKCMTNMY